MKVNVLLAVCILLTIGCSQSEFDNPDNWKSIDIGTIKDVRVIPLGFSDNIKTEIYTTERYLIIKGTASNIPFGNDAFMLVYKNGKRNYLAVDGHGIQYIILD